MSAQQVQTELATLLSKAFTQGGLVPPAAAQGLDSIKAAYDVQRTVETLTGLPRAGWKVGMTNRQVWSSDTKGPSTAPMFHALCYETPAEFFVFADRGVAVESEFAFRFDRDLPPRPEAYSYDEALDAADVLMPAIEIVGTRFEGGFKGVSTIQIVADLVAHVAFVSGPSTADWRDLDLISHSVRLVKNGKTEAEGTGASVLDGPLSVLEWTANHLSSLGEGISAGEIVTTGTCTQIIPVVAGDNVVADFGSLGSVELKLMAR